MCVVEIQVWHRDVVNRQPSVLLSNEQDIIWHLPHLMKAGPLLAGHRLTTPYQTFSRNVLDIAANPRVKVTGVKLKIKTALLNSNFGKYR